MSTKIIIPDDEILIKKIHIIRNQKVMLDKDLAAFYGVIPLKVKGADKAEQGAIFSPFYVSTH